MTEEEAVRLLWVERVFARMVDGSEFVLLKPTAAKKISELIERQTAEIEKSKRCGNCEQAKEHWDELYGCKLNEDAKFNRRNTCERWELVK